MALTNPSIAETQNLFREIEEHFPAPSLGPDRWYILAIASISAGGHPALAADLYQALIARPEFATCEARQALVRRLREALMKLVSVVGVPKPIESIFCISEVERDEDKDYSFSREHWNSGPENVARGKAWLAQIYQHNHAVTEAKWAAHRDFAWLSEEITYGLYLSDHSIIDGIDTELVVLSGIMLQNLPKQTAWHLRGIRRVGVAHDDVELIQQCIEKVATFCGLTLSRVPRVKDIEHEVPFEQISK